MRGLKLEDKVSPEASFFARSLRVELVKWQDAEQAIQEEVKAHEDSRSHYVRVSIGDRICIGLGRVDS
jgi:PIN domain nuclease of toxin-antitoxin system